MYWKIASLVIFALFCGWSCYEAKKHTRLEQKKEDEFWEREREANSVRRKPIDHLDYIKIPKELPVDLLKDNIEMPNILKTVESLRNDKILNLTGYSNTDLKLEYGAPNLTELSRYDSNFTALVTTFQKWADLLLNEDYEKEAVGLMEYIVSIGGDIGKTYRLLGKYYLRNSMDDKFDELIKSADSLRSLNKPYILQSVKDLKA